MNDIALLVINMQAGSFRPPVPVSEGEELLRVVAALIAQARRAGTPVIYVQNDSAEGYFGEPDSPDWEIHPVVAPAADEPVIRKRTPDAFQETDLEDELNEMDIRRLIICGLATEIDIDTTVRRAYLLGYQVILVSDAHSTWDGDILDAWQAIDHHNAVLGSVFAECLSAEEVPL